MNGVWTPVTPEPEPLCVLWNCHHHRLYIKMANVGAFWQWKWRCGSHLSLGQWSVGTGFPLMMAAVKLQIKHLLKFDEAPPPSDWTTCWPQRSRRFSRSKAALKATYLRCVSAEAQSSRVRSPAQTGCWHHTSWHWPASTEPSAAFRGCGNRQLHTLNTAHWILFPAAATSCHVTSRHNWTSSW